MEKLETSADVKTASGAPPESVAGDEPPALPARSTQDGRRLILLCSLIFLVAAGCRLLSWQDNRFEARKVQTAVTDGYKHTGRLLREGGIPSFFSANSPLSDPNHLGHPPGYPIIIAVLFSLFGEADAAVQLTQILVDSAAAVVVFLMALSLLNRVTAVIAGLLVALAPQFTYNSVMLLPDSLSVFPVLLAVYFLVRAVKRPSLVTLAAAGALVGLSCWLRGNAMLLAPFTLVAFPLLFERGRRLRYAAALLGGTIILVAPLTIRNYIVYDHFIPVSLGAGQTLLIGLADYDTGGSLGIPTTDMGLLKQEAEIYNRPDYFGTYFNPDGVKRERARLARSFSVIRSHPFWFLSVMARRALYMLRLERVRLISPNPQVTRAPEAAGETPPVWSGTPADLMAGGRAVSAGAEVSLAPEGEMLRLNTDESKYDDQFTSPPIPVAAGTDYVLRLPVRIIRGRAIARVAGDADHSEYASAIIDPQDWKTEAEQPLRNFDIPFVSRGAGEVRVIFGNGGQSGVRTLMEVGQAQVFDLGPASYTWTRIPRLPLRLLQKLFITAVMLPLALAGLFLLVRARRWRVTALLLIVPAYFLCVQSALHTEYRYVLVIHYFFFVLAAVALHRAGEWSWQALRQLRRESAPERAA